MWKWMSELEISDYKYEEQCGPRQAHGVLDPTLGAVLGGVEYCRK